MRLLSEIQGAPFSSASSRSCSFLCSFMFSSCGTIKRLTISAACTWRLGQLPAGLNGMTATGQMHAVSVSRILRSIIQQPTTA